MALKTLILILFFYFLALWQTSFLAQFVILGLTVDAVLISVILINLFISSKTVGFASALMGGFFLDIFSSRQIGWHIFILLSIALLIKIILKRYVRVPLP